MRMRSYRSGFTLIELLVVIAIIGILASIVLASLQGARGQAKDKSTAGQLNQIKNGMALLELHTGKTIRGCSLTELLTGPINEISLDDEQVGLHIKPDDLSVFAGCRWTDADIANWNGPYIQTPRDPWGNAYWYDTDYHPRLQNTAATPENNGQGCDDPYPGNPVYIAIVSGGPNGQSGADGSGPYDCDDIFILLN